MSLELNRDVGKSVTNSADKDHNVYSTVTSDWFINTKVTVTNPHMPSVLPCIMYHCGFPDFPAVVLFGSNWQLS